MFFSLEKVVGDSTMEECFASVDCYEKTALGFVGVLRTLGGEALMLAGVAFVADRHGLYGLAVELEGEEEVVEVYYWEYMKKLGKQEELHNSD